MLDLVSGVAELGTGMPGDLRAAVFPVASGPAQPWALATFGLCRLELDQRLRVTGIARKGIGKYQTELLDLGQNLLGVGQRRGKSLLLVSKEDGSVRTRIRVAGACAATPSMTVSSGCLARITAKPLTSIWRVAASSRAIRYRTAVTRYTSPQTGRAADAQPRTAGRVPAQEVANTLDPA
ncbi:hypothetical protein [Lentzea albidocapillata]|uniref:hypothetical protein n=1 Tax=Lentzea albidocapillata TaxID=40571 RepID=UPI00115FCA9B|nr:hypothetical protein [Lentzea albidocapillata]